MRRSRIAEIALAVTVATVAGACSDDGGRRQAGTVADTLTVGVPLALTGSLAREGSLMREGYDYCVEVVNRKGGVKVGNRSLTLKLRYEDDRSEPAHDTRVVDEQDRQGIELVLGPYGSAATEAVAAAVEKHDMVLVEGGGADDNLFTRGRHNTFAVISTASQYLTSMVQALGDLADPKPATVAILSADDGFSTTATAAGRAEAERRGIRVVTVETVPSGSTDVGEAVKRIQALAPDLVLASVHLQEGMALVRQSEQLGFNPRHGFGITVAPVVPDFVQTLGTRAEYVLSSSQWTPQHRGRDDWFGSAADYAAGFQARFGRVPGYQPADASAACLALVMAVQNAGSAEPAKVRRALADLDTDSFFGSINFDETGKNPARGMSVVQIQDARVVTVWPDTAAHPLRWPAVPFSQR